jgi:A/G-specific adenine glycosylase
VADPAANFEEGAAMRRRLLRWYAAHRRRLPWRQRRTRAYRVWVSEIMLQQTRVAAATGHYRRFLRRFPSVRALAGARVEEVLAAWSGLGYYRRARMLHQAAREIVRSRGGRLPKTAEEWRELPGVGRYTAAAIASICHHEPVAVVDGNVERVLTRLRGQAPRDPWAAAQELLSPARPGDSNQAMMELGALVCTPRRPACDRCPLRRWCVTQGEQAGRPRPPRRRREAAVALAVRAGKVYLRQRPKDHPLMGGMWELPEMARPKDRPVLRVRHAITQTDHEVQVYGVQGRMAGGGRWVARERLETLPLTGLTRKILGRLGILTEPAGE